MLTQLRFTGEKLQCGEKRSEAKSPRHAEGEVLPLRRSVIRRVEHVFGPARKKTTADADVLDYSMDRAGIARSLLAVSLATMRTAN